MEKMKKILVPTDGSDCSLRATTYAINFAKNCNAEIYAIYVVDTIILKELARAITTKDVEKELKEKGERYLDYVVESAEKEGITAEAILTKGEPHDQIVLFAKTKEIDLIVMGSYGRRGTKRILIGSVTSRVIEYAPCPVLVVK
jgi:nucleotide-binding universal stress UspA family protein